MINEQRFKAYRDDLFYGMGEDQVEFIRFLDVHRIEGVLNPYRIFGYHLIGEEYSMSGVVFSCWRSINNVDLLTTDDIVYLVCKREALITFVDLVHWILNQAAQHEIVLSVDLPRNKMDLFRYFLDKHEKVFFFNFTFSDTNEGEVFFYRWLQLVNFYPLNGKYEDNYFRCIMIKEKKVNIFNFL